MKKLFTFILGLGMVTGANAQMTDGVQARVYAYDLQQEESTAVVENETVKAYTFTFKTNTAANEDAKVILFAEGQNDVVVTATATDDTKKSWTATVTGATAGLMTADYNWKVEVSALAVNSFTELANPYSPYRSYGLTVNTNPESDYFGTTYMTHQYPVEGRMSDGIYAYDPLLVQTNYKAFDFIGDANGTAVSPRDINIAEDGRLFLTNYNVAKSNVYWVSPDLGSSGGLFGGSLDTATGKRTNDSGDYISGLCGGVAVRGGGENTQLYVTDHTLGSSSAAYVLRYDIGSAIEWEQSADWQLNSLLQLIVAHLLF